MTKKIKMEYIGKERIFTNNSAYENNKNLEKMTNKLIELSNSPDADIDDIYLSMGEYVSTIFENFDPKELFEAEQTEIYLIRGLNTLKDMMKMGQSKKEIDKAKKQIIERAIEEELFRI